MPSPLTPASFVGVSAENVVAFSVSLPSVAPPQAAMGMRPAASTAAHPVQRSFCFHVGITFSSFVIEAPSASQRLEGPFSPCGAPTYVARVLKS